MRRDDSTNDLSLMAEAAVIGQHNSEQVLTGRVSQSRSSPSPEVQSQSVSGVGVGGRDARRLSEEMTSDEEAENTVSLQYGSLSPFESAAFRPLARISRTWSPSLVEPLDLSASIEPSR